MTQSIHQAAQYLATAAKSFLPPKNDDSHTNLGWNHTIRSFETHSLDPEGLKLALNLEHYSLDVNHPVSGVMASFPLTGAKHLDVVNWIERETSFCGLTDPYQFELHYELPYDTNMSDAYTHTGVKKEVLKEQMQLRWLADKALSLTQSQFKKSSPIRIWPHHFDTGMMGYFDVNTEHSIGLGLAIPDALVDDYYFYVSGYQGDESINPQNFEPLKIGAWKYDNWIGAMLPASGVSLPIVSQFLAQSLAAYKAAVS